MASPVVPTTKITLDVERTMRMDLNAMCDFEMMTGKSITRGGLDQCPAGCKEAHEHKSLSISDIRALLWACLKQTDSTLSLEEVGAMLHPGNIEVVSGAVTTLFGNAMPEAEGDSDPDPLPETPPPSATGSGGTTTRPRRSTISD